MRMQQRIHKKKKRSPRLKNKRSPKESAKKSKKRAVSEHTGGAPDSAQQPVRWDTGQSAQRGPQRTLSCCGTVLSDVHQTVWQRSDPTVDYRIP
jgi:hypothetical protein